jgi:hypothetical protein
LGNLGKERHGETGVFLGNHPSPTPNDDLELDMTSPSPMTREELLELAYLDAYGLLD